MQADNRKRNSILALNTLLNEDENIPIESPFSPKSSTFEQFLLSKKETLLSIFDEIKSKYLEEKRNLSSQENLNDFIDFASSQLTSLKSSIN